MCQRRSATFAGTLLRLRWLCATVLRVFVPVLRSPPGGVQGAKARRRLPPLRAKMRHLFQQLLRALFQQVSVLRRPRMLGLYPEGLRLRQNSLRRMCRPLLLRPSALRKLQQDRALPRMQSAVLRPVSTHLQLQHTAHRITPLLHRQAVQPLGNLWHVLEPFLRRVLKDQWWSLPAVQSRSSLRKPEVDLQLSR